MNIVLESWCSANAAELSPASTPARAIGNKLCKRFMLSFLIFVHMTLSVAIAITGVPLGLQSKEYVHTDEAQEHEPDDNPEYSFPV